MSLLRLLLALLLLASTAYAAPVQLDSLKKGDVVEGFRVDARDVADLMDGERDNGAANEEDKAETLPTSS